MWNANETSPADHPHMPSPHRGKLREFLPSASRSVARQEKFLRQTRLPRKRATLRESQNLLETRKASLRKRRTTPSSARCPAKASSPVERAARMMRSHAAENRALHPVASSRASGKFLRLCP